MQSSNNIYIYIYNIFSESIYLAYRIKTCLNIISYVNVIIDIYSVLFTKLCYTQGCYVKDSKYDLCALEYPK